MTSAYRTCLVVASDGDVPHELLVSQRFFDC